MPPLEAADSFECIMTQTLPVGKSVSRGSWWDGRNNEGGDSGSQRSQDRPVGLAGPRARLPLDGTRAFGHDWHAARDADEAMVFGGTSQERLALNHESL